MIYDLTNSVDVIKFDKYCERLKKNKKRAELKEKTAKRSNEQNRYLHLMLTWFACELGYSLAEAKQIYKEVNQSIYGYQKKGHVFWKKTATRSIIEIEQGNKKFRHYATQKMNIYLPLPNEEGYNQWVREMQEAEKHNYQYL